MDKLKLAAYWGAGCGGCDTAVLDLHEKILDLAAAADIVFWPIAVDTKYADVERMPDRSIDVTLYNGAVRNAENEEIAHLLRRKSKVMVAFGTCAHLGGIPGLANLFGKKGIFERAYHDCASVPPNGGAEPQLVTRVPEGELRLPEFHEKVRTLDMVVDVDYYLPGCPPPAKNIWAAVEAIVSGSLPPKGAVIGASDKAQCDECTRTKTEMKITELKRMATAQPDPTRCFLEQGFLCTGPATRGGCDTRCQKSGNACRGCFGPPPGVHDQAAKALSAIASLLDTKDPEEVARFVAAVPDPVRTFNRYGIPSAMLGRRLA